MISFWEKYNANSQVERISIGSHFPEVIFYYCYMVAVVGHVLCNCKLSWDFSRPDVRISFPLYAMRPHF